LFNFTEANQPYYIQNADKSINIPVNSIDCIRIHLKLKKLNENPHEDPTIWSSFHISTINIIKKTVILDNRSSEKLVLVPGKTYERPRQELSLKMDPSNCNLKAKWPKKWGEYGMIWAETEKEDISANPSIMEVVMGIYENLMDKVES